MDQRPRTYVPGMKIRSADLNLMFDTLIAERNNPFPAGIMRFAIGTPSPGAPWAYSVNHTTGEARWNFSANLQLITFECSRLRAGDVIEDLTARALATSSPTASIELKLWIHEALNSQTLKHTVTISNSSADEPINGSTALPGGPYEMQPQDRAYITALASTSTGSGWIKNVSLLVSRPPAPAEEPV